MISKEVTITIQGGLNSGTITHMIAAANTFSSKLTFQRGEKHANVKSMLGVLSMRLLEGDTVTLVADGADEEAAVTALLNVL